MTLRRTPAALLAPLAFAAAAGAQAQDPPQPAAQSAADVTAIPTDEEAAALRERDRRLLLTRPAEDILGEDGMLASADLGEGAQLGIGRFRIAEPAESRSWMERETDPTDMRREHDGIAAIGIRMPF